MKGEDGDDESDSSDLKEDSSPEEETEVKSEDNSTDEEASSIDSDKSKEENYMSELTNSDKSDNGNEMPELTNSEESHYDSEEDSNETESELENDDGIYLITSVENLRRREVQGFDERKIQLKKRPKKRRGKRNPKYGMQV